MELGGGEAEGRGGEGGEGEAVRGGGTMQAAKHYRIDDIDLIMQITKEPYPYLYPTNMTSPEKGWGAFFIQVSIEQCIKI